MYNPGGFFHLPTNELSLWMVAPALSTEGCRHVGLFQSERTGRGVVGWERPTSDKDNSNDSDLTFIQLIPWARHYPKCFPWINAFFSFFSNPCYFLLRFNKPREKYKIISEELNEASQREHTSETSTRIKSEHAQHPRRPAPAPFGL